MSEVNNGEEFLDKIAKGVDENPNVKHPFLRDGGVLINILEITAIHPEYMDSTN